MAPLLHSDAHSLLSVIRFSFAFRSSGREACVLSDEVGATRHPLMPRSARPHNRGWHSWGSVCPADCVEVKAFTLLACHVFSVAATRLWVMSDKGEGSNANSEHQSSSVLTSPRKPSSSTQLPGTADPLAFVEGTWDFWPSNLQLFSRLTQCRCEQYLKDLYAH